MSHAVLYIAVAMTSLVPFMIIAEVSHAALYIAVGKRQFATFTLAVEHSM